jgi:putative colanic acid biosynthesis acetyltransferase WcaF
MTLLDASQTRPDEGGASFSLGNRAARALWGVAWLVLARWTPPPMHAWRRIVLKAFGAKIGRGVRVHASVRIWLPANLELGDFCLIGPGAILYNQGRITVGPRAVLSQRSHICASSHDLNDPHFQLVLRPISIGAQAWVAAEAFVGPGVTMGARSVLAARGALFRSIEDDAVYTGNPASFLKKRALRPD